MVNWDEEADKAAEKADAKLSAGVEKLLGMDLAKAFPNPADAKMVGHLVQAIKSKTDKNERVAAFKAIGVTLGVDLFKAVRKLILASVLVVLAGAGMAQAQMKTLDLSNPLADPRAGFSWDGAGGRFGVAYVPVMYWIGESSGLEYATINWGASDNLENGRKTMLVSIGPRIDNVFTWLAGGSFAKKHLRFAALPPVQVTVDLGTSDFKHFRPRLSLVTRFGGR